MGELGQFKDESQGICCGELQGIWGSILDRFGIDLGLGVGSVRGQVSGRFGLIMWRRRLAIFVRRGVARVDVCYEWSSTGMWRGLAKV